LEPTEHNDQHLVQVGLTQESPCSYLPGNNEQLILITDDMDFSAEHYQQLLQAGFRRSGNDIYKPHCPSCQECQSLRLDVNHFVASKSQKRIFSKNKDLKIIFSHTETAAHYPLYEKYINTLHKDGGMYPATPEQYNGFLKCQMFDVELMQLYLNDQLIAVAVTDPLPNAMSAVYFYYDPDFQKRSLGVYAVLAQIEHLKSIGKQWLYLGFQIDDCQKMNYKSRFQPHQRLINEQWLK